ncbi:MAG TPA: helix-turn-helix transcriptional regulator [Firmicutes bacterium]|nr:helix-turn-helix transcriptional regulator [Bacillota bacterium]
MGNKMEDRHNDIREAFQSFFVKKELLAKVIDCFPYPIQVYAPDGTSVLVNKAMLAEFQSVSPDMVVGKYNVFKDPAVIATGQIPVLKRAFQGETVFFPDVKVPLEEIVERYGIRDLDIEAVYQDITVFPLLDDEKRVLYVAAFFINRRVYRGKDEITKAKEYIESHWQEPFDLKATAKAACLSKAHFTKLFKKHTGVTPHEYYINYKISKVKEKLLDTNLSISQAFAACNMDYNGHSARVFKAKTGVSPSAYRECQVKRNEV